MSKGNLTNVGKTQHSILHENAKKVSSTYLNFAIIGAAFCLAMDLLIFFTKDFMKEYSEGRPELTDWNNFFKFDEWIQWTILGVITVWLSLEIGLAKLLQTAVKKESRNGLKLWIIIYCIDVILSYTGLVAVICFVMPSTKILLGISAVIFSIAEIYYSRTIVKYFISLKTTATYSACQSDDEKV